MWDRVVLFLSAIRRRAAADAVWLDDGSSPLPHPITHVFPLPPNSPLCTSLDYYRL